MDRTAVRQRSKALLGSGYRLEIAAAIAEAAGEAVNAQELADLTGLRYPRVQHELKHLLDAGVLISAESVSRAVEYKAVASEYWKACQLLLAEWC